MAETRGLVQRLSILSNTVTCAWVGPTPDNVEALVVSNDGSTLGSAFATSIIYSLMTASSNYREIVAVHGDNDATITSLQIEPV